MRHDTPTLIRYQAKLINDSGYKDHERYNFKKNLDVPFNGIDTLKHWTIPGKKYAVYWLFAFHKSIFSKVLFATTLRCYEDVALIPILIVSSKKVVTIDYIGYNYTCNNADSLTNINSNEAERSRALDFLEAYHYAVENFTKLNHVSILDVEFFVTDYNRRLKEKFDSLPENLKEELSEQFDI